MSTFYITSGTLTAHIQNSIGSLLIFKILELDWRKIVRPWKASVPAEVASPISQLLPYLTTAFSTLKLAVRVAARALRPIRTLSPAPALLYLLAPVFVFLDITATLFLRTPYRTALYLLDAAFPLYVFVGVACITGGILGLVARVLSRVILVSLEVPPTDVTDVPPR